MTSGGIGHEKNPAFQLNVLTVEFDMKYATVGLPERNDMGVSKNRGAPKSSILIGFSIIFTIHFGGFPPWKHPYGSQLDWLHLRTQAENEKKIKQSSPRNADRSKLFRTIEARDGARHCVEKCI